MADAEGPRKGDGALDKPHGLPRRAFLKTGLAVAAGAAAADLAAKAQAAVPKIPPEGRVALVAPPELPHSHELGRSTSCERSSTPCSGA